MYLTVFILKRFLISTFLIVFTILEIGAYNVVWIYLGTFISFTYILEVRPFQGGASENRHQVIYETTMLIQTLFWIVILSDYISEERSLQVGYLLIANLTFSMCLSLFRMLFQTVTNASQMVRDWYAGYPKKVKERQFREKKEQLVRTYPGMFESFELFLKEAEAIDWCKQYR